MESERAGSGIVDARGVEAEGNRPDCGIIDARGVGEGTGSERRIVVTAAGGVNEWRAGTINVRENSGAGVASRRGDARAGEHEEQSRRHTTVETRSRFH
ncbi:MAG: hypothetical protein ACLP0B_08950 [Steroidobacteraceae bacterium]